jgi:hypothetical protein
VVGSGREAGSAAIQRQRPAEYASAERRAAPERFSCARSK